MCPSHQAEGCAGLSKSKVNASGRGKKQDAAGQQVVKQASRNKRKATDVDYEYDQEAEAEVSLWHTKQLDPETSFPNLVQANGGTGWEEVPCEDMENMQS